MQEGASLSRVDYMVSNKLLELHGGSIVELQHHRVISESGRRGTAAAHMENVVVIRLERRSERNRIDEVLRRTA